MWRLQGLKDANMLLRSEGTAEVADISLSDRNMRWAKHMLSSVIRQHVDNVTEPVLFFHPVPVFSRSIRAHKRVHCKNFQEFQSFSSLWLKEGLKFFFRELSNYIHRIVCLWQKNKYQSGSSKQRTNKICRSGLGMLNVASRPTSSLLCWLKMNPIILFCYYSDF